jgi:hypothetical protein
MNHSPAAQSVVSPAPCFTDKVVKIVFKGIVFQRITRGKTPSNYDNLKDSESYFARSEVRTCNLKAV